MADAARRNANSASSKSRKSKNEIIRSALGMYLKQRNYSANDKFRKSDLALTQSVKQTEFSTMLDNEVSKVNSFIYSNVLCLSNNPNIVDQQFSKFLVFAQSQSGTVKAELQTVLSPLLCHLYIELLKGKDSQPAQDFLKKFAYIIGPIDNHSAPLAHKINGSSVAAPSLAGDQTIATPSSTSQITFVREPENDKTSQEYFKELVQSMSTCLRIEELDSIEITRTFRYSKYETDITLNSLFALKHFLVKNGHAIILHILQTWFSFEISDVKNSVEDQAHFPVAPIAAATAEKRPVANVATRMQVQVKKEEKPMIGTGDESMETKSPQKMPNIQLRNLRRAVLQMKLHAPPIRVFKIANVNNRLTSGVIDANECHLACGFDDSTIKLWQLSQSTLRGRKPFSTFRNCLCEWSLEHDSGCISSNDSDTDDDDDADKAARREAERRAFDERNNENVFTDSRGISLRGHSRGVTDVLFSKQSPLLISVSKDNTMRAWKASNYVCGAVYRGHNYPIWCVAESSVGLYMATGSRDLTAKLWSTDREFPLQTYVGHTQDVDAIAFHPNGNYIATGSTDLTVRLWCVTSGKLLRVFTDCHLPVQCVSFSPDGKLLAAAGEESKIRIFDLAAGSQLSELKDHTSPIISLAWNSCGNKIASCSVDGTIKMFNVNKIYNTQSSQPSTSSPSNKPTVSYASGCRRSVKTFFNSNDTISCIGSS